MSFSKILFALGLLAVTVGCGPHYEEHKITDVRASAGGTLSAATMELVLPEGAILSANVVPYDSGDDPMDDGAIVPDDPTIVEVIHVAGAPATKVAFVGRHSGTTTLRYRANGQEIRSERATVSAP